MRSLRASFFALILAGPAIAQTALPPLEMAFLPPEVTQRDLCNRTSDTAVPSKPLTEGGEGTLSDAERLRFLASDIRNYQRRDAALHFDFISDLITRRASFDAEFAGIEESFARIDLYLAAGRLSELDRAGFVRQLVDTIETLGNQHRVRLAQYLRMGVGIAADPARAQELIRDAAYDGHARALLEIAHLQRQGLLVDGWTAPLDLTVTMAFGGMLGEMTPGVCGRAERIAQEYLKGEVVAFNPEVALAWRRFAADLGSVKAAWRVVEYYLGANELDRDRAALRHYLRRAVALGHSVSDAEADTLAASGVFSPKELFAVFRTTSGGDRGRALLPYIELDLELGIDLDGMVAGNDGAMHRYLEEVVQLPSAPGQIFTRLAAEVSAAGGRWAAENEILDLLEEAVRRDDPDGMARLAQRLIRYRDDPARIARAEALLIDTVDRFGRASSMDQLDTLYRCQVNDAPRLAEATHWARAYRASSHWGLPLSAVDLVTLDAYKSPEAIARIQSQALQGRSSALADQAQRVQSMPLRSAAALRYWASRLDNSDQALEAFAELQFELARGPAERAQALAFFRRIYLNNGVTTALDLAVALIEDNGRDPEVAAEIRALLVQAGNRGEGAAIRLLSRLDAARRSPAEVYAQFAEAIEARGDFLALMIAIPHLPEYQVDDYVDRAVSLMNCGSKDADELGEAFAARGLAGPSFHWRQVGLGMEGGHLLSKLQLSDPQVAMVDTGAAPGPVEIAERIRSDGGTGLHRRLFAQRANPDLVSYDPEAAATEILRGFETGDIGWALGAYRGADRQVQRELSERADLGEMFRQGAESGDRHAAYALGMILRDRAQTPDEFARSARWLEVAAQAGHDAAMVDLGVALGFGLGIGRDRGRALDWLDRAAKMGHPDAAELVDLIRASN